MRGLLILLTFLMTAQAAVASDWLGFRGDSTSRAPIALPSKIDTVNGLAWKSPLPGRGVSGPIIVGDRVYLTCSSGAKEDRMFICCLHAKTGKKLWQREYWATGRTLMHPDSANAAPTPTSDGEAIYAFFSSNDLICVDIDGNLRWARGLTYDYPKAFNDVGMSSSPIVVDGVVIAQVECQVDSFVAGIDAKTGENKWRIDRPKGMNWASPVALNQPGKGNLVVLQSATDLSAHDPASGKEVWKVDMKCNFIASTVAANGKLFVPLSGGVTALELPETGAPKSLWSTNKLRPGSASAVTQGNNVLTLNGPVLNCGNATDGSIKWQLRLKGKQFWATPIVAGDHIYCFSAEGGAEVIKIGDDKGEVVSTAEFGERIYGSPAVGNDGMFIRGDKFLYKVAN
jgi:outer membrane protein assembly factor BamB